MKNERKKKKKKRNPKKLSFMAQVASVWHILRWLLSIEHVMQRPILVTVQKDTNLQMESYKYWKL